MRFDHLVLRRDANSLGFDGLDAAGGGSVAHSSIRLSVGSSLRSDSDAQFAGCGCLGCTLSGQALKDEVRQLYGDQGIGGKAIDESPQFLGDDIGDNTSTTTTLTVGNSISSSIQHEGDLDYIRVTLVAGQTYTFHLDGGTLVDGYLELRDAAGTTLISFNDDGGILLDSFLMHRAASSGTYYIVARAFEDDMNPNTIGTYTLSFNAIETGNTSPTSFTPNGEPFFSWTETAIQITRSGASWATQFNPASPTIVTYAFRSTQDGMPADVGGFSRFNPSQIAAAEAALAAWAAVANIQFQRVGTGTTGEGAFSNNAAILFGNYSTGQDAAAAFAFLPSSGNTAANSVQGDIWVNISLAQNQNLTPGTYGPQVLLHEIGHALGLSHPGDYNAGQGNPTYGTSTDYYADTRMFTAMSYFSPSFTFGALPGFASTPQLHDIAAIQRLYGANANTRTGDTTYGFNSNTNVAGYTTTSALQGVVSRDGGGNDTLDFSLYTQGARIDLREEAFSNVGPSVNNMVNANLAMFNVSIARGSVIENAIGGSGDDTIIGNAANNVLNGGAGGDQLQGGAGDDLYIVDTLADFAMENNNEGTDTVQSSSTWALANYFENLILVGGAAINGTGNGENNIITGNSNNNTLTGWDGADTLHGGDGDDTLVGEVGNDTINGGNGADTLIGGAGIDVLDGGLGGDTISNAIGDGGDSIDGGGDFDTLNLSGDSLENVMTVTYNGTSLTEADSSIIANVEAVNADLGGGVDWLFYTATVGIAVNLGTNSASGFASIANFENVIGGSGNDTLIGNSGVNTLNGGTGNDALSGLGGNDILRGAAGSDLIVGGLGVDNIDGGSGDDSISYSLGDGPDVINGGADSDTFNVAGDAGENLLNLTFDGVRLTSLADCSLSSIEFVNADLGSNTDWLIYSSGSAGVVVDLSLGSASGFATVLGVEKVVGGGGNDSLTGSNDANTLNGGTGDDTLSGLAGNDVLRGAAGNDLIVGGLGVDNIDGGAGSDTVEYVIGAGSDFINGGSDSDVLNVTGGGGEDILNATFDGSVLTSVADCSIVNIESITANTGAGSDWLIYSTGSASVVVDLSTGVASGFAQISEVKVIGGGSNDIIAGNSAANTINGGGGDDIISGGGSNDVLRGASGADSITGGTGNDNIDAGSGNDTIFYNAGDGADTIDGGDNNDTFMVAGTASEELLSVTFNGAGIVQLMDCALLNVEAIHADMGSGTDWLIYSSSTGVSVDLGAGIASGFASIAGLENAIGGIGSDTLTGSSAVNRLEGGDGSDTLSGGQANDILRGGNGDDTIVGGVDNDTLTGGVGADRFVYAAGHGSDTIIDFDADASGGQDLIDITGFGITAGDFGTRVSVIDMGAFTTVTIDGSVTITLNGVDGTGANLITQSDFLLV